MIADLQELVRQSGLSQRVIAQRADLPEKTLGRILHRQQDLKWTTLEKLARALGHEVVLVKQEGQR
jgi:transcriptional regulator with XRE-family HTH domain